MIPAVDRPPVPLVRMPQRRIAPSVSILRRLLIAIGALGVTVLVVYLGRSGYRDVNGDGVSLLDAFYYATVSLSTTGYGDITPVSDGARLVNVLVVTPLRVLFVIVLVGTTIELLTERSRQEFRVRRWRSRVRDHIVVVGYGTKGRSAVAALLGEGADRRSIVVVDTNRALLDMASSQGLVTVSGDGTKASVLQAANVQSAEALIVATNRDDTAVLVTLTARELNSKAHIAASVREEENVHLLRQSGADVVVVSSETAGRLLGVATHKPHVVELMEDLLSPEMGLAIAERDVEDAEVGGSPRHLGDIVLGVVRDGRLFRVDAPAVDALEHGDRLLYVRKATPAHEERSRNQAAG
jgi:voltage-gated potassium channel